VIAEIQAWVLPTLSDMRTPFLRLQLPIIVRRVERGEAKLVGNVRKLGEYLALASEDIERLALLFSGPSPAKTRPPKKKINHAGFLLKCVSDKREL